VTCKEAGMSNGTAKRMRKNTESAPETVVMTTVVCDQCGERFAIGHREAFQDINLAKKQAVWLDDQLVWDHIRESKHHGSIRLPALHEMK
jgi:hypothetical protein